MVLALPFALWSHPVCILVTSLQVCCAAAVPSAGSPKHTWRARVPPSSRGVARTKRMYGKHEVDHSDVRTIICLHLFESQSNHSNHIKPYRTNSNNLL